MATDPHEHVINKSGIPRFEESSARHTPQYKNPIGKLLDASSYAARNGTSNALGYTNTLTSTSPPAMLENIPNRYIADTVNPVAAKGSRQPSQQSQPLLYQPTEDEHSQADPERASSRATTASQSTPHRIFVQHPTTLKPGSPVSDNKRVPTVKDRNFRYMYLTDDQIGSTATASKYTGRLVSHEVKKINTRVSSESNDSDSLSTKHYACTQKGCAWSFSRPSDLRRHAKSHQAPAFHCPYYKIDPSCHRNGGSFARSDVLKRHLRLMHFVKDKQMLYPGPDPGWCRSCQKMFESTKEFLDHCSECAAQSRPTVWRTLETNNESAS